MGKCLTYIVTEGLSSVLLNCKQNSDHFAGRYSSQCDYAIEQSSKEFEQVSLSEVVIGKIWFNDSSPDEKIQAREQ